MSRRNAFLFGTPPVSRPLQRECFVTVGATASFLTLIDAVTSMEFLKTLNHLGYSHLTIQCGQDLEYVRDTKFPRDQLEELLEEYELVVKLFGFNKFGLGEEMKGCKAIQNRSREGIVVSHAGSGTILDAMRIDVPIIVVPNPALLDNHQEELARELDLRGHVTYGDLTDLSAALRASEVKSDARTMWPPVNDDADQAQNGVVDVLDEELGYEMHMREILD